MLNQSVFTEDDPNATVMNMTMQSDNNPNITDMAFPVPDKSEIDNENVYRQARKVSATPSYQPIPDDKDQTKNGFIL